MANKTVRIIAGIGLLYYSVLRGVSALAVGIRGYQFAGLDFSENTLRVKLFFAIKNPLLVGVKLRGIVGDVYMQGIKVGEVNSEYNYFLSGCKTHIVPITVTCNISSLGEAVIANIQTGNINTLTIAFDGYASVGNNGVTLPVQTTLNWEDLKK